MLVLALMACGAARAEEPPPGVRCLARHFTAQAEQHEGHWGLRLPDGTFLPWDDGRAKTFEWRPELFDADCQPRSRAPYRPQTLFELRKKHSSLGRRFFQ